ncbi:EpsG family protein [Acinetobacter sp. ANC 4640]
MLFFISIYLFVFIVYLLSRYLRNNVLDKLFIIVISGALSVLPGFRAVSVGTDTEMYYNILDSRLDSENYFVSNIEPGYIYLVKIFQALSLESYFFLFVSFFANYLFVSAIFSLKKYRFIALLSYLTFSNIYMMGFNILRQYLALAIYTYSLTFLFKGRNFLHLIFIILAISFHYSSVIFFLFSFMYYLTMRGWSEIVYAIGFLTPFVYNFIQKFLIIYFISISGKESFESYINKTSTNGGVLQLTLYILILIFILSFSDFKNKYFKFYFSIFLTWFGFFINISYFGLSYEGAGRLIVSTYFSFLFIFPFLNYGKAKEIIILLLSCFFIGFYFYFYFYAGYHGVIPYKFI